MKLALNPLRKGLVTPVTFVLLLYQWTNLARYVIVTSRVHGCVRLAITFSLQYHT